MDVNLPSDIVKSPPTTTTMSASSDSEGERGSVAGEPEAEAPRRTTPLTPREKSLLTKLVTKYRSIIENKRTNGEWVTMRQETWNRLADEFNYERHTTKRTSRQLKKCWENSKRMAKKDAAKYRKEWKSSGSNSPMHEIPTDILRVMYVAPSQINSDSNAFEDGASFDEVPPVEANILNNEEEDDGQEVKPLHQMTPTVLPETGYQLDLNHHQPVMQEELLLVERDRQQHERKMNILDLQYLYEKRKLEMLEEEHKQKMKLLDAKIAAVERNAHSDH